MGKSLYPIHPPTISKHVKVAQLCLTLCDPTDYTVHGILQARILEWVSFPFSRGSSQPRDRTQISRVAGGFFTSWATREALIWSKGDYLEVSVFGGFTSLKWERGSVEAIGHSEYLHLWGVDGSCWRESLRSQILVDLMVIIGETVDISETIRESEDQ